MAALPRLDNRAARRAFLHAHALGEPPSGPATGPELMGLIRRLGFVQVDSIATVERAHHMILWARRSRYRPDALRPLLERDRALFEHWTHDAALIPTEFLPYWQQRFARDRARLPARWAAWQGHGAADEAEAVLAHIRAHGPCGSGDLAGGAPRARGGWWDWHPSKTALEFLWRTGALAIARREGFAKIYDLAERVYPPCADPGPAATIDWACGGALDRLSFATSGELAAFWGKVTPDEAKVWCADALRAGTLEEVAVEGADGQPRRALARPGLVARAAALAPPPDRLRLLSPFDPLLRDRARAARLFGFHYRIEVFVPAPRRLYGYYVFPLLEGDRIVGRIDLKARREAGEIAVTALWPEPGVRFGKGRMDRLMAELDRLGRFTGCPTLTFAPGWLRPPVPAGAAAIG